MKKSLLLKKNLLLPLLLAFSYVSVAQTQFWSDDFESPTSPSSGTRIPTNNSGSGDAYFRRATNADLDLTTLSDGNYSNYQGSYFWAGENLQTAFGGEQQIVWIIDISGKSDIGFKGLFGANANNKFESTVAGSSQTDYIIAEYAIDGGTYQQLIAFYIKGGFEKNLFEDTNGDLLGDGAQLSKSMTEFTKSISGSGNTLTLRLRAYCNSTNEEFAFDNFRLSSTPSCTMTAAITAQTNVLCNGEANGALTVSQTGGASPFNYSWSNGSVTTNSTSSTNSISSLSAGSYSVTITDANGCTDTASVTVTEPTALTATTSKIDVSCNGAFNGTASVSASGGIAPYSYSWSPSGGNNATASGLAAGTYTCTIFDDNACSIDKIVTVNQPTAVTATTSKTDVTYNGGSDGTASVSASGGIAPYSYSWSPSGGNNATASGLAAGTYTCTIFDDNACSIDKAVTITQPVLVAPDANNILYVNKTATGDGSGGAWANALPELADALKYAKQQDNYTSSNPLKIFVAGGTYKPLYSPEDGANNLTDQGRDNSFLMVKNVQLYGGFAGTETTLEERDLSTNTTIMSGDRGSIGDTSDNSYHVAVSVGEVGSALINGFVIKGANGSDAGDKIIVGSANIFRNSGGGLNNFSSPLSLMNVKIIDNNAYHAGGIYNETSYTSTSTLTLENVLIADNTVIGAGGGMYNYHAHLELTNVTIIGNSAGNGEGFFNESYVYLYLSNCILWNTVVNLNSQVISNYSIIKSNSSTANGNIDATGITASDIFNDPANGDYSLKNTSPAVNTGSNQAYTGAGGNLQNDLDLAGNPRVYDGSPNPDVIDMGAFELQEGYVTPPIAPDANNILYVDKNVDGGNGSGKSWANALPELADALKYAKQNESNWTTANPLQIWVTGGTYKPMYSPEDGANNLTDQGRDNSFLMVNNVQLYGGFAGTETTLADRDLSLTANATILSGDVNGDDDISGSGNSLSITNNGENIYHVLMSSGDVGSATLDGFTLTGGNANAFGYVNVNSNSFPQGNGGGMFNSSSSPSLANVTLSGNSANTGGGMANSSSSPNLKNTVLFGNTATYGGGMYNYSSSSPSLANMTLSGNSANYGGGGMYNESSSPSLVNVALSGNSAGSYGGGMYNSYSSPSLKNTVLFGNTANISAGIYNDNSSASISHSLVQGQTGTSDGNIGATGITADDIFADFANGDYSLKNTSPAINAGSNQAYTDAGGDLQNDMDLAGNPRLYQTAIDMGAYEFQGIQISPDDNNILYVDKNVSGGDGSGGSWVNALSELADALVYAKQNENSWTTANPLQIWVAGGTYKPLYSPIDGDNLTDQNRDNSFLLVNNVQLYGGFAGTETTLAERDLSLTANATVLSGDIAGDDVISGSGSSLSITNNGENNYHVLVSSSDVGNAALDGFTIIGGNADDANSIIINGNSIFRNNSGGMYNYSSSPSLGNLTLSGNSASNGGGGMYNFSCSPSLTNVTLSRNSGTYGGGMYNNSSSPSLANVTLNGNSANTGGGMSNFSSSPSLKNTVLFGNTATYGGGMYNYYSSFPSLTNVTLSGNSANKGGGMYNYYSSSPTLKNTVLFGNTANSSDAGIYNDDSNSTPSISYSLVQGETSTANGNIDATGITAADIFADPANGDYSLQATSPAINAGSNQAYTGAGGNLQNDMDLAGNPRLYQTAIDMGAYEYQGEPVTPATEAPTTTYPLQLFTTDNGTLADLEITGANIQWYDAATAGNLLASTTALADATVYYATQTVDGTESAERLAIEVNEICAPAQDIPAGATVADLTADPSSGTAQWYAQSTGGNALAANEALSSGTYYVEQFDTSTETIGSGFSSPSGVTIDAAGNILVADTGNSAIKRMDANGDNIETLGSGFSYPYGVAVDAAGNILVADYAHNAIKRMDANGDNIEILGSGFSNPFGVGVDANGNILVTDFGNSAIKLMDANGDNIETLGSGFSFPTGVAVDANGNILVADTNNSAIKRMDANGNTIEALGSGFSYPYGVAVDTNGNILVADTYHNAIKRMDANGDNIETLGSGFSGPTGVAVDANGNILVADSNNSTIKRINQLKTNRVAVQVNVEEVIAPNNNNVLFVDKDATGTDKGGSWANALTELADALKYAKQNESNWTTTNPLQIWVAGGTYKPLYSPEDGTNNLTDQGRDNTFLMVKNVQLYGGFAGTETTLDDRDLSLTANASILSGDINGDDMVTSSGSTLSIANNSENNYHVVISSGAVGSATLDGFTINDGNADNTNSITINGTSFNQSFGGGVYNDSSSPSLANVTLSGNLASYGGGMFNDSSSSPSLANVELSGNSASYGGGMYNYSSSPSLTNVTLSGNSAEYDGGGIYNSSSFPSLTNVTLSGNSASYGGGMYNASSSPIIKNSILFGNTATNGEAGIYNDISTPSISYSLVQGETSTANGNIDATGITVADIFADPANGDYSLQATSPAINAGSNQAYTGAGGNLQNDMDLAGNPRLYQTAIDMGGYEYQINPSTNNILYVDKNVSGGDGSGNSWTNALPELADALVYAKGQDNYTTGDPLQIWVAGGTYKPLYSGFDYNFGVADGRNNVFVMVNNVQLYGGFAGTETTLADRDMSQTANASLLSGDLNGDDAITEDGLDLSFANNSENTYHVIVSSGSVGAAVLDGFTISGGNGNVSMQSSINSNALFASDGGGLHIVDSKPHLNNLTITHNYSSNGAGVFATTNADMVFSNSLITKNKASNNSVVYDIDSSPSFVNINVTQNDANGVDNNSTNSLETPLNFENVSIISNKGGLKNVGTSLVFNNGLIANNESPGNGGGIYNSASSSATFINVAIIANYSITIAGAIFNQGSLDLINATVINNSAGFTYNGILNDGGLLVINSIIWNSLENSSSATTTIQNSLVKDSNDTTNGNSNAVGLTPDAIFNDPTNGDYSLKATSPAVNAGDPNTDLSVFPTNAVGNAIDLSGNPRVYEGNPDPDVIDMGAYEFQGEPLPNGYVWKDGSWTPMDPNGTATASDNITVMNGTTAFTQDIEVNDITVMSGATLNVDHVLTINGDITNNGNLVFKSTATSDGELAAVPNSSTITGNVTVERYMGDYRSFHFVSPAVTTTSSIHANWQEGATSATNDPNMGFGTHITGTYTADQENGFDITASGSPSLFTLNAATQSFDAIGNTDVNNLEAGKGYFIYVRGSRAIDLTSNTSHSSTTLRATGTLQTGPMTKSLGNVSSGNFVAVGNPYQSSIDVNDVISGSTNLNGNYAYVYDPTLAGGNGAYTTVDLSSGSASGSTANQYVQPGQAVQVATLSTGPTEIAFHEADKAPGNHTATFSNENPFVDNVHINGHLYTAANYAAGETVQDNFSLLFDQGFDNALNNEDAVKPTNITENMGIGAPENPYSIERRALPLEGENIALFNTGYATQDYTLVMEVSDFGEDATPFLVDSYTGEQTELQAGENVIGFSVDQNVGGSMASNRFHIHFGPSTLAVGGQNADYGIQLYPNPAQSGAAFYITAGQFEGQKASVKITDLLGKTVYSSTKQFAGGKIAIQPDSPLGSGVYFVRIAQDGKTVNKRLVVN